MKKKLIVALDVNDLKKAEELIDILSPVIDIFKIGIAPFTAFGNKVTERIEKKRKKIFLDLKVHDIPNTVQSAARNAADKNVFMMNFHCLGGMKMLEAAVKGARQGVSENPPLLLGVTILTSMKQEDMNAIGISGQVREKVIELALLAKKAGLDGVVASPLEVKEIKEKAGKEFIVVTPGIRPEWAVKGDQKRILTPRQAIQQGADYIVVGRPILEAKDPAKAAALIIEEMEQ
ncbi:MAG: orotidine-5'-phosphate decarboxylase [Candidatus Omnitrophota bacterium]